MRLLCCVIVKGFIVHMQGEVCEEWNKKCLLCFCMMMGTASFYLKLLITVLLVALLVEVCQSCWKVRSKYCVSAEPK